MCNSKLKNKFDVSVLFHNLKGYDANHIMKAMPNFVRNHPKYSIKPIPISAETFISFSLHDNDAVEVEKNAQGKKQF